MKLSKKKIGLIASVFVLASSTVFADSPVCGDTQDESWMEPELMQEQLESMGYTIESMAVSEGYCYQVTGLNVEGKNVTAYFDPRTGGVVQEDIVE